MRVRLPGSGQWYSSVKPHDFTSGSQNYVRPHNARTLTEAIRKLNDLSDVIRAIGLSVGELEKLETALIGLLAQAAIDDE
jgi:hypothetical protein